MKSTIAVAFPGGAYGTYVDWCINTLVEGQIFSPFTDVGNSHNFQGHHLNTMENWRKYLDSDVDYPTVRVHPKGNEKNESLSENLNNIADNVKYLINVYPSPGHELLVINNAYTKIYKDWWVQQFQDARIDLQKIHDNWPTTLGLAANQIPNWVQREFLSYYMMPMWYDMVEWFHPEHWRHPRAITIYTKQLLFDFENTMNQILNFCSITPKVSVLDLVPYHEENLKRQHHLDQDWLCQSILDSVVDQKDMDWSKNELPMPSQAWIQMKLRENGLELKCDGLDNFPTHSVELQKLLYRL